MTVVERPNLCIDPVYRSAGPSGGWKSHLCTLPQRDFKISDHWRAFETKALPANAIITETVGRRPPPELQFKLEGTGHEK
jgi:hypothetical protein